jgi:N-formylglutamate amidohydrolase
LGIPAYEDKIVQLGLKKILESIYAEDFLDFSYGFRPGRSCHDALIELDRRLIMKSRMPELGTLKLRSKYHLLRLLPNHETQLPVEFLLFEGSFIGGDKC